MSFRRLLDRRVTIVPRIVTGKNARGGDVVGDGTPIGPVRAARDLLEASEVLEHRDEQARTFAYMLELKADDDAKTPVTITGYDRILDGDNVFEVRGDPELVVRRRGGRPHHYEAVAYLIEG